MATPGKQLRERRKTLGITQQALAKESGVSYSLITKLETVSSYNPTLGTWNKLLDAMNKMEQEAANGRKLLRKRAVQN